MFTTGVVRGSLLLLPLWGISLLVAVTYGQLRASPVLTYLQQRGSQSDIGVVDVFTGVAHDLTRHPALDFSFTWAPDGAALAFVSDRSGRRDLYIMQADGRDLRAIPTERGPFALSWSPTGERIAYLSTAAGGHADIFLIPASGGAAHNLTNTPQAVEVNILWSPDGTRLATSYQQDVVILAADGGAPQQRIANGHLPDWSPDGRALVYRRAGDAPPSIIETLLDAPDLAEQPLGAASPGTVAYFAPVWSPDGTQVAYWRTGAGAAPATLQIITVASGQERTLPLPWLPVTAPAWSPDGAWIAFAVQPSAAQAEPPLLLLHVADGRLRRLNLTGRVIGWRP